MTVLKRHYAHYSMRHKHVCSAFFILSVVLIIFISGCKATNNNAPVLAENVNSTESKSPRLTIKPKPTQAAISQPVFAPTVEGARRGVWHGGPPPINKRASGINTYYQIEAGTKPNHLLMKLRFEGVVADDALVRFKGIDGARFELADQRSEWNLKPDAISEISFGLIVPETTSYLTLFTLQDKRGASRAFLLEFPPRN